MAKPPSNSIWIATIVTLTVCADQISKFAIRTQLSEGDVVPVLSGVFNLALHFNPGVAFGLFADLPARTRAILLGISTLFALGLVGYFLRAYYRESGLARTALGLILGGAIGNLIDRVQFGRVVDFLDFYYGSWHWPTFNVADSAICVGVTLLIFVKPIAQDQIGTDQTVSDVAEGRPLNANATEGKR